MNNHKKKVVIISRTLLPSQAPRSFRTTELAKELSRIGHDVTVYAVLGEYDYSSFEADHGVSVKNIGSMNHAKLNSDGSGIPRTSFFKSAIVKVLKKLIEYPDIELAYKVAVLIRQLQNIDLLITIAVPYPIHWGAAYGSRWFTTNNIKTWVADCGDPYMGNKVSKKLFYFKYVEKWFLRKVDFLTIPVEEAREAYYKEFHDKIRVIPQGFRFDEHQIKGEHVQNEIPLFIYAGVFYKGIRDPRPFLEFLSTLSLDFRFVIYTKPSSILDEYRDALKEKLVVKNYIPRSELLKIMSGADFLVNIENNTKVQSPSKLIDYALTGRPILSISSSNLDESKVLEFLNEDYTHQLKIKDIEQYDIRNVAKSFIELSK